MFHLEEEDNRRPFSFKYGFQKHYVTKTTANHVFFPWQDKTIMLWNCVGLLVFFFFFEEMPTLILPVY